jgi:hypothetical protein
MKRRIAPRFGALAQGALVVLLALGLAASADAAAKSKARTRTKKKTTTAHASGLKAYVDPATGKFVRPSVTDGGVEPTAAAARVAAEDAGRDVPVLRLANGTEMARLDERFQEFEVARIGADGKLVRTCVQGPARATIVRETKPAPAKELQ